MIGILEHSNVEVTIGEALENGWSETHGGREGSVEFGGQLEAGDVRWERRKIRSFLVARHVG